MDFIGDLAMARLAMVDTPTGVILALASVTIEVAVVFEVIPLDVRMNVSCPLSPYMFPPKCETEEMLYFKLYAIGPIPLI